MISNDKFNEFVAIVKRLRKECPWDREQTNDSIKAATIEEAYEVVQSIDEKNFDHLKSELGDLLLHVVFHSIMAEENNHFSVDNVIDSIREKLIRRHPHVFGDTIVTGSDHVKQNWEKIKLQEGRKSVIDGVPVSLPALQRAHRLQEKAAKVGFDWEKKEDVWAKVEEEMNEMKEAESGNSKEKLVEEVGDLFFALVNYARFLGINPEDALRGTNAKFEKRFNYIERKIGETGRSITDSNLAEMDQYWNESKSVLKDQEPS